MEGKQSFSLLVSVWQVNHINWGDGPLSSVLHMEKVFPELAPDGVLCSREGRSLYVINSSTPVNEHEVLVNRR